MDIAQQVKDLLAAGGYEPLLLRVTYNAGKETYYLRYGAKLPVASGWHNRMYIELGTIRAHSAEAFELRISKLPYYTAVLGG